MQKPELSLSSLKHISITQQISESSYLPRIDLFRSMFTILSIISSVSFTTLPSLLAQKDEMIFVFFTAVLRRLWWDFIPSEIDMTRFAASNKCGGQHQSTQTISSPALNIAWETFFIVSWVAWLTFYALSHTTSVFDLKFRMVFSLTPYSQAILRIEGGLGLSSNATSFIRW